MSRVLWALGGAVAGGAAYLNGRHIIWGNAERTVASLGSMDTMRELRVERPVLHATPWPAVNAGVDAGIDAVADAGAAVAWLTKDYVIPAVTYVKNEVTKRVRGAGEK